MKDSVKDDLGNGGCGLTPFVLAKVLDCASVGTHTKLGIAAHSGITRLYIVLAFHASFPLRK